MHRRIVRVVFCAGVLLAATTGCGGGAPDSGTGDAGIAFDDPLACEAFCSVEADCLGPDDQCVDDCLAAPELSTDVCREAHEARNACVGQLDCEQFMEWQAPTGETRPCDRESTQLLDACSSSFGPR